MPATRASLTALGTQRLDYEMRFDLSIFGDWWPSWKIFGVEDLDRQFSIAGLQDREQNDAAPR
jgi:hypothetical protein